MYVQKVKYDKKCLESKLAKETMEQFTYTYLNQVYGIKKLVHDYSNSIVEAINKYPHDLDVYLFGKVYNSEIDEGFISIAYNSRNSASEAVKEVLRKKHKAKAEGEVLKYHNEYKNGKVLEEWLWKETLQKLANYEATQLIEQIEATLKDKLAKGDKQGVLLTDLQDVVFRHEIMKRKDKAAKFAELFKKFDTDKNGVVNQEELAAIMLQMKVKINVDKVIKALDPNNVQQLTFSDCFKALSSVSCYIYSVGESSRRCYRKSKCYCPIQ
eukprot:TRINITY_DN806_c0_g1_i1.p1 TRINITY_DN806_c0_g1~~TRINITY_DN806_c0_g1_i1.p1  ORF type:complete len:269 (-),score=64.89 TRINITY_DN806_c0_g1_i1:1474-2280(-)